MNIQLTEELEQLVEANIRSGRYQSASEVVAAALRLMERTASTSRDGQASDLIEEGWLAAQRGETVDGDGVFDRIDAELEALETSLLR
jgi:antitoxin ParD1/3/4